MYCIILYLYEKYVNYQMVERRISTSWTLTPGRDSAVPWRHDSETKCRYVSTLAPGYLAVRLVCTPESVVQYCLSQDGGMGIWKLPMSLVQVRYRLLFPLFTPPSKYTCVSPIRQDEVPLPLLDILFESCS